MRPIRMSALRRVVACGMLSLACACLGGNGDDSELEPAPAVELVPAPTERVEPRVIGVENPQTERLPLLNPGGVNGSRGPRQAR